MSRFLVTPTLILVAGLNSVSAHAGHHHETGLPDFAAHLLLGLQYLAAILILAVAIFFFFRSKKSSKSQTTQKSQ